ncbi:MAG: lipopolysaccharide assembly LapA domain-containing protein [bacterium]
MAAIYRLIFLIIVLALMLLAIVIGIQNGVQVVDVDVLTWSWNDIPLVVVMIECIVFGMFLTVIISAPYEIRLWARLRAHRRELKMLKVELDNMRNLPLTGVEEAVKEQPAKEEDPEEKSAE